VDRANTSMTSR